MLNSTDKLVIKPANQAIDYKSLALGYASLIKDRSLQLYLQLVQLATLDLNDFDMQALSKLSGMSLEVIEQARFNLEKYGLIKTYQKDHNYWIQILAPLDLARFLSHEVYGRMYIQQNGEELYKMLMQENQLNKPNDYVDISSHFSDLLASEWSSSQEHTYHEHKQTKINQQYQFDFDKFLANNFEIVWPKKHRSQQALNEIARLANLYAHDEKSMRTLVCDCIDIETKQLDLNKLKQVCANSSKTGSFMQKDPYQLPPKAFLKKLQPNAPISKVDQEVIEMLIDEYHFSNEVCNKLIEYALAKSNYRLNKKFVGSIASTWARANVDTMEKAKMMIQQDTNKTSFDFKNPYQTLTKPDLSKVKINGKAHKMEKQNDEFDDF